MNFAFNNFNVGQLIENTSATIFKLIIIVIIFFIVKAIGKKIIDKSYQKIKQKGQLSLGRIKTLERLSLNIFSYTLYFIFIIMVFDLFGYNPSALLAGAGIAGLAIGFGAKDLVSDVVTGFFLLLEKQFDVDDYVTTGNYSGIIEEIGIRTTHIRDFDGTLHYIPNRQIVALSNHSRGSMRALIDITIPSSKDVDQMIKILQDTCDQFASENKSIKEGPHVLGVQSLGTSDVVIRIIARTENMMQWEVERELKKHIKKVLDSVSL